MIDLAMQTQSSAPAPTSASWLLETAKLAGAFLVGYVLASIQARWTRTLEQRTETKALVVSARHLHEALLSLRRDFDAQYEKANDGATRAYFLNEPVALPTLPLARFVGRGRAAVAYEQGLCNSLSDLCDRLEALQLRYDSMREWALIPDGWPARLGPYQSILNKAHDAMRPVLKALRRYASPDTLAEIDRLISLGN